VLLFTKVWQGQFLSRNSLDCWTVWIYGRAEAVLRKSNLGEPESIRGMPPSMLCRRRGAQHEVHHLVVAKCAPSTSLAPSPLGTQNWMSESTYGRRPSCRDESWAGWEGGIARWSGRGRQGVCADTSTPRARLARRIPTGVHPSYD
jgi:hypothetical protein